MSSTSHNCAVNTYLRFLVRSRGPGVNSAKLNAGQGEQIHWLSKNSRSKDSLIDNLASNLPGRSWPKEIANLTIQLALQNTDFADKAGTHKNQEKHTSELTLAFGR